MVDIPYLDEDDLKFLRELRRRYEEANLSRQTLDKTPKLDSAKSFYLASVPSEGLPGISGAIPGNALCDIYRGIPSDGPDVELVSAGFYRRVHNVGPEITSGYIKVDRDAYGLWWASESSSSMEIIRFSIDAMLESYVRASVTILGRACGDSSSISGSGSDTTEVVDELGCLFDEPDADLIGRKGYAVRMNTPAGTGTGTGSGSASMACQWEVISLCCPTGITTSGTGS